MNKTAKLLVLIAMCIPCSWHAVGQGSNQAIEIHAHRYNFEPAEISVKKGDTVRLKLISDDVPHSLLIQDLGINQTITKGKPAEVTFTAKNAGTFQGRCGRFCGSGHGKMTFTVHVTGN